MSAVIDKLVSLQYTTSEKDTKLYVKKLANELFFGGENGDFSTKITAYLVFVLNETNDRVYDAFVKLKFKENSDFEYASISGIRVAQEMNYVNDCFVEFNSDVQSVLDTYGADLVDRLAVYSESEVGNA